MAKRKKWPYILGSIALVGASILIRRQAMKMRDQADQMESVEPIQ